MDAAGSGVSVALAITARALGAREHTPPFAGQRLREERTQDTQAMANTDVDGENRIRNWRADKPCFTTALHFQTTRAFSRALQFTTSLLSSTLCCSNSVPAALGFANCRFSADMHWRFQPGVLG